MPLYEYQCDACGHRFEVIQKFSDPPIAVCPSCGGAVHKLQSAPAFQFKGTGWYVTDYAKSGSSADGSHANESHKAGSKDGEKADAKTGKNAETGKSDTQSSASKSAASSTSAGGSTSASSSSSSNKPGE